MKFSKEFKSNLPPHAIGRIRESHHGFTDCPREKPAWARRAVPLRGMWWHVERAAVMALVMLMVIVAPVAMPAAAQEAVAEACMTDYAEGVDYFPDKVEPEYSAGWTVEYFDHYKVVEVLTPFPGAADSDAFTYVLVECGTPAPDGYDDASVIEIPAGDVIAMSTTYIPHLEALGLLDHLVGMDTTAFVSSEAVQELAAAGALIEVGSGPSVNVEAILDAEPGLVLTFGSGSPDYDTHPTLIAAGVPVVVASDFIEPTPLGQAEWVKFVALFYNAEATANAVFDEKVETYNDLLALTAAITDEARPSVLWNSYTSYGDAWFIPGTESFAGQFVTDAGGVLVLADDPLVAGNVNATPFSFEAVYEAGLDADMWMPGTFGTRTLDDLAGLDARFADFAAFQNGEVYNYDARENINGGNDYFESGAANPQVVLADLIRILHPELLPDHELVYFRKLG